MYFSFGVFQSRTSAQPSGWPFLRRCGLAACAAFFALSLSGCDKFFNKNTSSDNSGKTIKLAPAEFKCVSTLPASMKDYFSDNADAAQTAAIFSCIDTALVTFNEFAIGQDPNSFTSTELQQFVNRYLQMANQVTDTYMQQIMKVKVFFIGGSDTVLTRDELQQARKILNLVGQQALALRGNWNLMLLKSDRTQVDSKQVTQVQTLAQQALRTMLDASKATNSNYTWTDLLAFLQETGTFMNSQDMLANLLHYMPLADGVRKAFLGASSAVSTMDQWHQDVDWSTQAYGCILQYHYFVEKIDISTFAAWSQIMNFAESIFNMVQTSPQMQSQGVIPVASIDSVIDHVYAMGMVKSAVTAEIAKNTYKQVLGHIIQRAYGTRTDAYAVRGLEDKDVTVLQFEFHVWKMNEISLLQAFGGHQALAYTDLLTTIFKNPPASVLQSVGAPADQSPGLSRAYQDWLNLLNTPRPMLFDQNFAMLISQSLLTTNATVQSMSYLNVLHSLTRFFMMGYGQAPAGAQDLSQSLASQASITNFNADFRDFELAIHMKDPRQTDSDKQMFDQARLFTYSGQGGTTLTATNFTQEVALMISGGAAITTHIMEDLDNSHCLIAGKVDTGFGLPMTTTSCYHDVLKSNFPQVFANLPLLVGEEQAGRFPFEQMFSLMQTIGSIPQSATHPGYTEYAEIRQQAVVLHYLESLMSVYDLNKDQMLDQDEVTRAVPRFQSVIAPLIPSWATSIISPEDAFLYVTFTGQIPPAFSLTSMDGWLTAGSMLVSWTTFTYKEHNDQLGTVQRINLLNVISLLKTATSAKSQVAPQVAQVQH